MWRKTGIVRAINCVCLIALALNAFPALADEKADQIKKLSEQLVLLLDAYAGNAADIEVPKLALRKSLDAFEKKRNIAAFLVSRSAELTAEFASPPDVTDNLQRQVALLVERLEPVEALIPLPAIKRRSDALAILLTNTKSAYNNALVRQSITALQSQIETLEAAITVDTVVRRSTVFTILLKDPNNDKAIRSSKFAGDALKALGDAIKHYTDELLPKVYVVEARFGDIRSMQAGRSGRRSCNATDALRSHCLNTISCQLPPNHATQLCGYDPVPYAQPQYKIAVVYYACLAGGQRAWDDLASKPSIDDSQIKVATLRSPLSKVICAPEKKTAAMQ